MARAVSTQPLVFSLFRDGLSFPLLEIIALAVDGFRLPARGDVARFFCLGIFGECESISVHSTNRAAPTMHAQQRGKTR